MTRPTLLVGCPIWKRAWALDYWLPHTEAACFHASVEPQYVFVIDPRDEPTNSIIKDWCDRLGRKLHLVWVEETPHEDVRDWSSAGRYERMAYLRNSLLQKVRTIDPMFFFSLDSDIFLHRDSLKGMLDLAGVVYDAVGSKTYMTEDGTHTPSFGFTTGGGLERYESKGVFKAEVIMAIKLMTPKAYSIDYVAHPLGEDIGWSLACKEAGVSLGWDGRYASKHAMSPSAAAKVDVRCGF